MKHTVYAFKWLAALLLAASLSACGALSYLSNQVRAATDAMLGLNEPGPPDWDSVLLVAVKGARGDSAATVDLVCVSDGELSQALMKTTAKNWFDNKDSLLATYAGNINVLRREIVPQQSLLMTRDDLLSCSGLTAHLFVDYTSNGLHAANLDMSAQGYKVFLEKSQFRVLATD